MTGRGGVSEVRDRVSRTDLFGYISRYILSSICWSKVVSSICHRRRRNCHRRRRRRPSRFQDAAIPRDNVETRSIGSEKSRGGEGEKTDNITHTRNVTRTTILPERVAGTQLRLQLHTCLQPEAISVPS